MREIFFKPLTPDIRRSLNEGIDNLIAELNTCKPNAFVNMQIIGYEAQRKLINGLPDGYPIPCIRG